MCRIVKTARANDSAMNARNSFSHPLERPLRLVSEIRERPLPWFSTGRSGSMRLIGLVDVSL
jgi:hypothetical protein